MGPIDGAGFGARSFQNITSDSQWLYVADLHSVKRYSLSNGQYGGWTGRLGTMRPTGGDAGCSTATIYTPTPGWCMGGNNTGASDGVAFDTVMGITHFNGYLYVTSNLSSKISRVNTTTGLIDGWIGRVGGTSPTSSGSGNIAPCTGLSNGQATPGWCVAGVAAAAVQSGGGVDASIVMNYPDGITNDGTYLYVSELINRRIHRYLIASGEDAGWIGTANNMTGASPASCASTASGTWVPEWCVGGLSSTSVNQVLNRPRGIFYSDGFLYVAEDTSYQITKINAITGQVVATGGQYLNGPVGITADSNYVYVSSNYGSHHVARFLVSNLSYQGMLGSVAGAASGSVACSALAVGAITPEWCTVPSGGLTSTADGGFNFPRGVHINGTNLYVTDSERLMKYTSSTGAFVGWMGGAASSIKSTWGNGGTPGGVNAENALNLPHKMAVYGSYLYISDSYNGRVVRKNITTGTEDGWVGLVSVTPTTNGTGGPGTCSSTSSGTVTPGWCKGGKSIPGTGTSAALGALYHPTAITVDANYVYVATDQSSTISRYNRTTGAFDGWAGRMHTRPTSNGTGASNCTSGAYPLQSITPGWCIGGRPWSVYDDTGNQGSQTEFFVWSSGGMSTDGTYLYFAASASHRVFRFNKSTGVYAGWIGRINGVTSYEGNTLSSGCAGQSVGEMTNGWCMGGYGISTSGVGGFNNPFDVVEHSGFIYVADYWNHRIQKFNASTGAFEGWVGRIASTISGDSVSACNGLGSGAWTPDWCTKGTATELSTPGGIMYPAGLESDGTYLYIANFSYAMATRIQISNGAFSGWIGTVGAVAPTSGASGACTGAVNGQFTPGWCTGGSSLNPFGSDTSVSIRDIVLSGSDVYMLDINSRVSKFTQTP